MSRTQRTLECKENNVREMLIEGTSKVSSKGQVVVPAEIRHLLGIKEGDQLRFISKNGKIMIEPIKHLSEEELLGIFNETNHSDEFVLDLNAARESRGEEILNDNWMSNRAD